MSLDKSQVRTFGGRAAFAAFMSKLHDRDTTPEDWDALSFELKEAWIAAAHEANMIQYIIENEKPGGAA